MSSWNVAAFANANRGLDERKLIAEALGIHESDVAVEVDIVGSARELAALVGGKAVPLDEYLADPRLENAPLLFDPHDVGANYQIAAWIAAHKGISVLGVILDLVKFMEVHAEQATSVNGQYGRYAGTRAEIRQLIAEYGVWPLSLSYSLGARFRPRNRWRLDVVNWSDVDFSEFANALRDGDQVVCCIETKSPLSAERREEIIRRALRPIIRRREINVNLVPQGGVEQCVAFYKVLNDLKAEAR